MKKGWHWFMCNRCGLKYWRGHNAKFCYGQPWADSSYPLCGFLKHMDQTCSMTTI